MEDELTDGLLDAAAASVPVARVIRFGFWVGLLAFLPAAMLAGSGGSGDGFEATLFGALLGSTILVAMVVGWWTAPARRRRRQRR